MTAAVAVRSDGHNGIRAVSPFGNCTRDELCSLSFCCLPPALKEEKKKIELDASRKLTCSADIILRSARLPRGQV